MNNKDSPRPLNGRLQAVIFDWAGTTIDFGSRAPVAAISETFRRHDFILTEDEIRRDMGMAKRDHLIAILQTPTVDIRWRETYGQPLSEPQIEALYRDFLLVQKQVLADHCKLIAGCLDAVASCRMRGMRVGSTTGYTRELMEVITPRARTQGFEPDTVVCADDVACGRPAPWLCLEAARCLDAFPVASVVNVDDTIVGVQAGVNAGMWSVGVAGSGNLVGLSAADFASLSPAIRDGCLETARQQLVASGAHVVIDTVADLPGALDLIESRNAHCQRP